MIDKKYNAKLNHINARDEKHGGESVLACDLKFEFSDENILLDLFEPGLRKALFWKSEDGAVGELFEGHLPDVRFPKLDPIRTQHEFIGRSVEIESGIEERSHIFLDQCDIDKFSFTPKQGGTVVVIFRVQCHPTEAQAAKLLCLLGSYTTIKIGEPVDIPENISPELEFGAEEFPLDAADEITKAFLNTDARNG